MFEEALKSPESYLYYLGKVEIPFIGNADIGQFPDAKSGTYAMGIYLLSDSMFGYWSGSCLNVGLNKNWQIRIVKKV